MLGLGYVGLGIAEPYPSGSAPAVQTFPPIDFPNPRGKPFPADLRGFIQSTKLNLIGKDVFFGYGGPNYDYPNPRGYRQPIERFGFTQPLQINLLGQDGMFGAAGQTRIYDYPNPNWIRKRAYNANTFTQNGLALFRTVAPPLNLGGFPQRDFPNPRGYQRAIDLLSITGSLPIPLFTIAGAPMLVFAADRAATSVYASDSPSGQGWSGQGYMTKYEIDSSVQINGSFVDALSGLATDPSGVTLFVLDPAGVQSIYQYPGPVTRDATGHYHYTVSPSKSGTWTYKWQATGTFIGTSPDSTFTVNPSSIIAG